MKRLLKFLLSLFMMCAILYLCAPYIAKTLYPLKYEETISACSEKYELDKFLVMGIISAESRFSENAVSHKNAKGLMQLKDETASWCANKFNIVGELYEPEVNIEIGCSYIRYLLDIFDGDMKNALASYNAGQGNVKKWLEDKEYSNDGKTLHSIPYKETDGYVEKVIRRAKIYELIYGEKNPPAYQ